MLRKVFQPLWRNKILCLVLLLGTICWSLTMVKSGLSYSFGLGFWGANGHDGIWHLALINNLKVFDFSMPVFAGEQIKNYHIGYDLLLAVISRLTGIKPLNLYFQIIPPILAFLIGWLSYRLTWLWSKSKVRAVLTVFLVYFSGGFGWLITLVRGGQIGGESLFWAQGSVLTLVNPPYALSLVFLLSGLIFTFKYVANRKFYWWLLASLCFGLLMQIKAYAGLLALAGLLVSTLYFLLTRKDWLITRVFLLSLAVSILVFLPNLKNSTSLLVFRPFWFLETMMGLSDRLDWPKFYSAMMTFRMGGLWLKAILVYFLAFIIFLVGNLGLRLVGVYTSFVWLKNHSKIAWLEFFVLTVLDVAVIIPMFFLQKGTPWNTIQFFYYYLFFFSFLAAYALEKLYLRLTKIGKILVIILLIVLVVPNVIAVLRHFLPSRPPAMLSNDEYEALSFLAKEPRGVVLTYPFDKDKAKAAEGNPPRPLYLYASTAYVSAFSGKTVFLEDEVNLDITGFPWQTRRNTIESLYKSQDQNYLRNFLRENHIVYIYWVKPQRMILGEGQLGLKRLFENQEIDIYKVE